MKRKRPRFPAGGARASPKLSGTGRIDRAAGGVAGEPTAPRSYRQAPETVAPTNALLGPSSSLCPALIAPLRLLSRFFETVGQHMLRMRQSPSIWQQPCQHLRTRVHRELQDHVVQVSPRLEPMPLRPRDDRAQHRRTRTRFGSFPKTSSSSGQLPDLATGAPTRCCRSTAGRPACTGTTPAIDSARRSLLEPAPIWAGAGISVDLNSFRSRSKIGTASD